MEQEQLMNKGENTECYGSLGWVWVYCTAY